jgi:hypothetical protein
VWEKEASLVLTLEENPWGRGACPLPRLVHNTSPSSSSSSVAVWSIARLERSMGSASKLQLCTYKTQLFLEQKHDLF